MAKLGRKHFASKLLYRIKIRFKMSVGTAFRLIPDVPTDCGFNGGGGQISSATARPHLTRGRNGHYF